MYRILLTFFFLVNAHLVLTQSNDEEGASTEKELYHYELELSLVKADKYDTNSYLSSGEYNAGEETEMWIKFNDGINESKQPKFGVGEIKNKANDEWQTVRDFSDLSFCEKYPEYSIYDGLQKSIHQLIFGDKNGCAIEPGTKVIVPKKHKVSITVEEKYACGNNALSIVLQTPDGKNAVGLDWETVTPIKNDCKTV